MRRRRRSPFHPFVAHLEDKTLLAALGATWYGQSDSPGFDYVGTSESYTSPRRDANQNILGNDYQDIRIRLTGLSSNDDVTKVEVYYGAKNHTWRYFYNPATGSGTGNAYLARANLEADLYLEPWFDMDSGTTINSIKVFYGPQQNVVDEKLNLTATLAVNKNKRLVDRALGSTWVSQATNNIDLTGQGMTVGPDGNRDVRLAVTNLSRRRQNNGQPWGAVGEEKDAYSIYLAKVATDQVREASGRLLLENGDKEPWDFAGWRSSRVTADFQAGYRNPTTGSFSNALLINRRAMPSPLAEETDQADLYFSPDGDLAGQALTLIVQYHGADRDGKFDLVTVTPGTTAATDPWNNYGTWTAPAASTGTATWIGQDGDGDWRNNHTSFQAAGVRPGDVRVDLAGVAVSAITDGELSNQHGDNWVKGQSGTSRLIVVADPSNSANSVLFFPPMRDESRADIDDTSGTDARNARLTFRYKNGSNPWYYEQFAGGIANVGLREQPTLGAYTIEVSSTTPNGTVIIADKGGLTSLPNSIVLTDLLKANTAYPGVSRIRFRPGTYTMPGMVEVERPITLDATSSDPTATVLRWTQRVPDTSINPPATDPKSSSPIVINSSDVTLRGFTLRNDTDLNWSSANTWDDALVSIQGGLVDVMIDGMRLIGPKPSNSTIRTNPSLISAGDSHGTITNSELRGGATVLIGGPWTVTNNDYRGARPYTYTSNAFKLLLYHDVTLTGNEAYDDLNFPGEVGSVGNTSRFLLAGGSDNGSGFGLLVADNQVNQHPQGSSRGWIGLRADGSGMPAGTDPNQPEMMLTESYYAFFEGTGYQLSTDRQSLRISYRVGKPLRQGDVVAILDGSDAGRWVRVAQVIDNAKLPTSNPTTSTVLLDEPLPGTGTARPAIGVHRGFIDSAFRSNEVDISSSLLHANKTALALPGNHYDLEVGGDLAGEGNEFVGGRAFEITNYKTQVPDANEVGPFPAPDVWTRTPAFDVRIENNLLIDVSSAVVGPSYAWSPSPTEGRRYFEGVVRDNTVRWTSGVAPTLTMGAGANFNTTDFVWLATAANELSDGYLTFERNWSDPPAATPDARVQLKVNWGVIDGPDQPNPSGFITLGKKSPPPSDGPITIDNGDGGFTATTVGGGSWGGSSVGYGTPNDSISALGGAVTFTATAEWTFNVSAQGRYKVLVTWPTAGGNATNAPFTVLDGTVAILDAPIRVNQQKEPGGETSGWEQLGGPGGTFDLVRGTTLRVRLTNNANGTVVADAVRVEYVGPSLIVDDGDGTTSAGFSTTGTWASYTGSGQENDHRVAQRVNAPNGAKATPTATARWTFDGLASGRYRVWVTYVSANNRSKNAPYAVSDGTSGLRTVRLDQQVGADDLYDSNNRGWERLGGGSALYDVGGSQLIVELRNDAERSTLYTDGYVVADAVRVERVGDLAVDNDGGTTTAGTTGFAFTSGTWTSWTKPGFGDDHATAAVTGNPAGAATATATWTFADLLPGQYQVWVTWVSDGARTTDAPFTIRDGSTTIGTYRLDQGQDPSQAGLVGYYGPSTWQVLDDAIDLAGSTLVVELGNNASFGPGNASRVVVADAVRIVRVGASVADHDAPSAATTGDWDYWGPSGYDGDHATANGNGGSTPDATATWAFRDLAPGRYQVWATWVHSSNRATNAPFSVRQGTGLAVALPPVNQSTNTNDAAYPFDYYQGQSWRILDTVEVYDPLVTVSLGNHVATGKVVVADGVRLVRVSPLYADDGSRHVAWSGTWTKYDHPTMIPGLHGDHAVAAGAASSTATATWTFSGLRAGFYRVWATWVQDPGRATNAKYRVYNTALTDLPAATISVNQRLAPAQTPQQVYRFDEDGDVSWKALTSVNLVTGSTIYVVLANDADGPVVADGVWLERL